MQAAGLAHVNSSWPESQMITQGPLLLLSRADISGCRTSCKPRPMLAVHVRARLVCGEPIGAFSLRRWTRCLPFAEMECMQVLKETIYQALPGSQLNL